MSNPLHYLNINMSGYTIQASDICRRVFVNVFAVLLMKELNRVGVNRFGCENMAVNIRMNTPFTSLFYV